MSSSTSRLFLLAGILFAAHPALADDGLPQMDTSTFPSQIFWLFTCFVVLYVLMSKVSLPGVSETLDRRRSQKDGNLSQAAQWNEEAEKIKIEYEKALAKAQKTAAAAVTVAERAISLKVSEDQSNFAETSRRRLAAAEQNISKAKADALNSLSDIASDVASGMVEKIADVQVNKADAQKAVATAMKKG